jgi:hypothetical protein
MLPAVSRATSGLASMGVSICGRKPPLRCGEDAVETTAGDCAACGDVPPIGSTHRLDVSSVGDGNSGSSGSSNSRGVGGRGGRGDSRLSDCAAAVLLEDELPDVAC